MTSGSSGPRIGWLQGARHAFAGDPFPLASIALLALALLAGGASQRNDVPTLIVELGSLILLPWAVFRLFKASGFGFLAWPSLILAIAVITPILQLIPLSPQVWMSAPGGKMAADIYTVAGMIPPVRPLSLASDLTVHSALALVTPIAVFLSWVTLPNRVRRSGAITILVVVFLGLILGMVQLSTGDAQIGYLYSPTNYGTLVGFFSNRNHEASFLLAALPLGAALMAGSSRRALNRLTIAALGLALILTVIVALTVVQSRAGILLLPFALLFSAIIIVRSGRLGTPSRTVLIFGGILVVALILVAQFGLGPLLDRFHLSVVRDERFTAAPYIWQAALNHFPFGTGLGTFDRIFRSVEPLSFVQQEYLNHAHNDYLEILLETGLLGAAGVAAFLVWWFYRSLVVWFGSSGLDVILARGGSVVIGLLLVHSALDYPLRTLALSSVLAFSSALLVPPLGVPERTKERSSTRQKANLV